MYFSHLGVFLISVKPMTTENTENKTTPKICKITVSLSLSLSLLAFKSFSLPRPLSLHAVLITFLCFPQ